MIIDPSKDGIDHINIYSKGNTQIGRRLSNFAHTPFTHPVHGKFNSVEGFIYWLGSRDDSLRHKFGFEAKKYGQIADKNIRLDDEVFKIEIKTAIRCKLTQNPGLKFMFKNDPRPLKHYYVYGNKVVTIPKWDWIVHYLEDLKKQL